MTLQNYRRSLVGIFAICLAGIWGLAAWLRPLDGDLARVGGYAENHFGWNTPQVKFPRNLFTVARTLEDYDRYYDVVVLGDSFSCDQKERLWGWQNYFANRTGLSVITIDLRRYWPVEVFQSEAYRKHPPRLFVMESVERYLAGRTAYFADALPDIPAPGPDRVPPPGGGLHPMGVETGPSLAGTKAGFDTDEALGFVSASVKRMLGINHLVLRIPLSQDALFSSREDRSLLVYFDEVDKRTISPEEIDRVRRGMFELQKLVERDGATRMLYIVAPDKSSIYAPWLRNPADATPDLIGPISSDPRVQMVRTDRVLSEAIRRGIPDIYLPGDSHWGSMGNRVVADAAVEELVRLGFFEEGNRDPGISDAPHP